VIKLTYFAKYDNGLAPCGGAGLLGFYADNQCISHLLYSLGKYQNYETCSINDEMGSPSPARGSVSSLRLANRCLSGTKPALNDKEIKSIRSDRGGYRPVALNAMANPAALVAASDRSLVAAG
jgi:hypothetical protein